MNERIQELAWEAEDYAESIVNQGGGFHQAYTRKFAELLIEECANVADENYIHRGSRTCGLAIRLHFGVEE